MINFLFHWLMAVVAIITIIWYRKHQDKCIDCGKENITLILLYFGVIGNLIVACI